MVNFWRIIQSNESAYFSALLSLPSLSLPPPLLSLTLTLVVCGAFSLVCKRGALLEVFPASERASQAAA